MALHFKKYLFPVFAGIAVVFFGLVVANHYGLYGQIENLDKVFHFLGGLVLGWFFYRYFTAPESKLTNLNLVFVCLSVVCFFGVIWEFAEHLSSIYSLDYFPWLYKWFHGGTITDTLLDLVADMVGGLVFVTASIATKLNGKR